jgi:sulfane dehydrogenase subunit SoxC
VAELRTGDIGLEELGQASRNHGMPLEGLRYDLTPPGLHYVLIHFDIPEIDPGSWSLVIDGNVERELRLTLDDLMARSQVTQPVTLECAGNGRVLMGPRTVSQPWLNEAVGTAAWTGTPLAPLLREAGIQAGSIEVLFTGADHGVQGEEEQDYERSLSTEDASREEVILAWAMNGMPLPPQHGFPVRLVVPGWYGMTSVKWLTRIRVLAEPFDGFQQARAYRFQQTEDEPGTPVTRMRPRSLLLPPGFPDFPARSRTVPAGPVTLVGRAWSGTAPIDRVEVSVDGGGSWSDAALEEAPAPFAWRPWTFAWTATPGEHLLCSRATDRTGATQPLEPEWNLGGFGNNAVQRVAVTVPTDAIGLA